MARTTRRTVVTCLAGLGLCVPAGGCMSGMRYKVPMPSSLTIGTVRQEDDAALARVAEAGRRDDVAMATTK